MVVAGVRAVSESDMPGFLSEGGTGSWRSRNKTRKLTSGHQLQGASSAPCGSLRSAGARAGLGIPSGLGPAQISLEPHRGCPAVYLKN